MVSGCFLRDLWDRGSLAFLVGPPILILHVAPVAFFTQFSGQNNVKQKVTNGISLAWMVVEIEHHPSP